MAQGLLEASGYSDTPVTFGQALAMGMRDQMRQLQQNQHQL